MVEGVVGLMGQGKTYYATWRALQALEDGREVFANYHIQGAQYVNTWSEMMEVRDGLVVLDEANVWCPSRFWQKLDPRTLYYWSQSRKLGLDIIWTAQHEARVDTALREITYQVWRSRRIGRVFRYVAFMPEEVRKEKRVPMRAKWLLRRGRIMEAYDTFQLVDLGEQLLKGEHLKQPDYREPGKAAVIALPAPEPVKPHRLSWSKS